MIWIEHLTRARFKAGKTASPFAHTIMKYTKRILPILIAAVIASFVAVAADPPKGSIHFQNVPLDKVLLVYQEMSGCQLIEASDVKRHYRGITVRAVSPASKTDTLKLIEKAVLEQAGVVITRLDDKRVSVTFNDQLPISAEKPQAHLGMRVIAQRDTSDSRQPLGKRTYEPYFTKQNTIPIR
jgi:hypothetical protein